MKHVFLTGATGTIGSAVLARLLDDDDTAATVLVRARQGESAEDRLEALMRFIGIGRDDPRYRRVAALPGDITLPDLGVSGPALAKLASSTTHIIHSAASVKLTMSADEARATAVLPTRSVLALARRVADSGSLRKVDLVSTVGVWGRTPGHMPERPLPQVASFHNTYEAAKAEAERVVWADGQGLPVTVHRPSMVVGDTRLGKVIHFQIFYHLCEFLSGGRTFGVMPELGDTQLDTVPVDFVANAICWASDRPDTAGKIFHLCSGPERAIRLDELQSRVRRQWRQHGRRTPRLITIGAATLNRAIPLIGALAGAKVRRALRALPPMLAYLSERQGFSNLETMRTLDCAGLALPAASDYLDTVLTYYLESIRAAEP